MKTRGLTRMTAIALFAALAIPVGLAAAEQQQQQAEMFDRYTVIDLGTLGGTYSIGFGVNNRGWVNGGATLQGDTVVHASLWHDGVLTDLGTLGGPNSNSFFPLNEKGEVGGLSDTSTPDPNGEDFCGFGTYLICLPFVWKNGVISPLPTLGGNNGQALEVNNRGQVAGEAENTTPDPTCAPPQVFQFKPVVWDKRQVRELPTFPGDPDGIAGEINDKGQAAGGSGNCSSNVFAHALLWQSGTATDLGNLGGTMNNVAEDINNRGQVVGASDLPGDTIAHAFIWQNGVMTDLGTLPGDVASGATGINDRGQVVGNSTDAGGNNRAVLWQNGVVADLNALIPAGSGLFLLGASGGINSRGQIAGFALQINSGEIHAFLASPSNDAPNSDGVTVAPAGIRERPTVVLPENVRTLLQRRLALRYRIASRANASAN